MTIPPVPPTYDQLVTHAEKFGVEEVYEAGEVYLGAEDRGRLAQQLRRIDAERVKAERDGNVRHRIEPPWRLSPDARDRLLEDLIHAGLDDKRVAQLTGVSRPTVKARRILVASPSFVAEPA